MKLYNNFGVGKKFDIFGMSLETGLHHRQKDKIHVSRTRLPIEQFIKRLIGRAGNILGTLGNIGRMVFGFLPGADDEDSSSFERSELSRASVPFPFRVRGRKIPFGGTLSMDGKTRHR